MTDVRSETNGEGTQVHLVKARTWLVASGHYALPTAVHIGDGHVLLAMNALYTGGWEAFERDMTTVENASAFEAAEFADDWQLSW